MSENKPGKRGPRTNQAKMLHRLKVLGEIASSCPPLAELINDLARQSLSDVELQSRLAGLELALGGLPATRVAPSIASDAIGQCARRAERVRDANARLAILRQAEASVEAAIKLTSAEAAEQWFELQKALEASKPEIPAAVLEVAQSLVASGLTGEDLKSDALKERILKAAQGEAVAGVAELHQPKRVEVLTLAQVQQKWAAFPRSISGYDLKERPIRDAPHAGGAINYFLPRFVSLDEIEAGASLWLRALPDNQARYKLAREKITKWIAANKYRPGMATEEAQVIAWCFALGYVHDFLDGVDAFGGLTLASPWSDSALVIRRV